MIRQKLYNNKNINMSKILSASTIVKKANLD